MHTLTESEFLTWVNDQGIVLDPRYPKVPVLRFASDDETSRFWEVPSRPERRPHFLASALGLMGEWKSCYVWRHSGSWPDAKHIDPRRINDAVEYQVLAGLGLPMGTASVIVFTPAEIASLVALLFSTTVFGWSINEDLYVIPNNGSVIIQTDHHDVVQVSFRSPESVRVGVSQMQAAGFALPEELPDETFKPQSWLKGREP